MRIWTNEGEKIVHLTNVVEMPEQELYDIVLARFTDNENEILGDLPYEGTVVGGPSDPLGDQNTDGIEVVFWTLDQYVEDLRKHLENEDY